MKKLMKSKKALVALALALLIAAGGFTYAWFTVNAEATNTDIQGGRLRLNAPRFVEWYETDEDYNRVGDPIRVYYDADGQIVNENGTPVDITYYLPTDKEYELSGPWLEPGQIVQPEYDAFIGFELCNPNPDGLAIAEIVKIDNSLTNIEIWSDIDPVTGNAIQLITPQSYPNMAALAAAHPDVSLADLTYNLDPNLARNKVYTIGGEVVGMLAWSYDKTVYTATGQYVYYATMSALPKGYDLTFDVVSEVILAPTAGNRFQGCVADVTSKYESTQPFTGAVKAKWGENINLQVVPQQGPPDYVAIDSFPGTSARGFSIAAYDGPHLSIAEAQKMTAVELAAFFFPDLYD